MKNETIQLVADEAGCSPSQVQPDNTLEEDLGLEAKSMAVLKRAVETEVGKSIDDDEWNKCHTVQDIITLAGSELATH